MSVALADLEGFLSWVSDQAKEVKVGFLSCPAWQVGFLLWLNSQSP